MVISPLLGTVAACNVGRNDYERDCKFQTFAVKGSFSFLNILKGDHQYYPSADNVEKLVINYDEKFLTNDITICGITYSLGKDFAYTGHVEMTFYNPVFGNPQLGKLYPSSYSEMKEKVVYTYDFSAVPGGLDGTIQMIANTKDGVLSIRSCDSTGNFRHVQIKATSTNTFDPVKLEINIVHDGKVCGWPCVVPVSQTSNLQMSYAQLTDYCLNVWGLSENPYPAYLPLAAGVKTSYMVFTFMIGDDSYQGVSCNTFTQSYVMTSATTAEITQVYNAVWYVGDWGKANARMNNGFEGTVIVSIHNYNFVSNTYDYYSAQFNLEGFHRFNHQTLFLTVDNSQVSKLGTGYCLLQGDRNKC
jgi:hypothetical protein